MSSQKNSIVLKGGYGFIELGSWRIGAIDKFHFSFSHKSGYTSVMYQSDGTVHKGPMTNYNLWNHTQNDILGIKILHNSIEFLDIWRLSQIDNSHLSLSSLSGLTNMIWRVDGTKHPGPRKDFSGFSNSSNSQKVFLGENFVQIGYWRIGEVDPFHLSIGTTTLVADIYRSDGTIYPGPRMDYRIQSVAVSKME